MISTGLLTEYKNPQLSRSGNYVACAALLPTSFAIDIFDSTWMKLARIEVPSGLILTNFVWAPWEERLIIVTDAKGDEKTELWITDADWKTFSRFGDIAPGKLVQVLSIGVVVRRSLESGDDLVLVEGPEGPTRVIGRSPSGAKAVCVSPQAKWLVWTMSRVDGDHWITQNNLTDEIEEVFVVTPEARRFGRALAVSDDGRVMALASVDGSPVRFGYISGGKLEVHYSAGSYDITRIVLDSSGVVVFESASSIDDVVPATKESGLVLCEFKRQIPSGCHLSVRSIRNQIWLGSVWRPGDASSELVRFDASGMRMVGPGSLQLRQGHETLGQREAIEFVARDGLNLNMFICSPKTGRVRGVALLVHGGPHARDTLQFDRDAEWLASRGLVSVQVNFRGSSGRGPQFGASGNGEWSGKIIDDLEDGLTAALAELNEDPASGVICMGRSFGALAAMIFARREVVKVKGVIAIQPPLDIKTVVNAAVTNGSPSVYELVELVGEPGKDDAKLRECSPASWEGWPTDVALLLIEGKNDARVGGSAIDWFDVSSNGSLRRLTFPDEGHVVQRPANRALMYSELDQFVTDCVEGA